MENLIGYDIRFLTFETQVFIRRVRSTRAFYIVRDSDKVHANSSSLVQVQVRRDFLLEKSHIVTLI